MLRIPHCLDNQLIDGGKDVSPTHQPNFIPHKLYFFCYRLSKPQGIVRPEELGTFKSFPRNRPWRPIGLSDVKDPTLSR
jgi:hypothetical protein